MPRERREREGIIYEPKSKGNDAETALAAIFTKEV